MILVSIRVLLACLFLLAGGVKILDPQAFAFAVYGLNLFPWPVCAAVGLYLPWVELFCGLALLLRRFYPGALVLAITLLGIFLVVLLWSVVRGLAFHCGCFGPLTPAWGTWGAIGVDSFFLLLSLYLLARYYSDLDRPVYARQTILIR